MHRFIAGLLAVVLGIALVRADGINVPAPSWSYLVPASVQTALQIAVGSTGGPVINGGALGTPSSGTATNLSGTAASLTAGTVTTNANLTGDVTSVGNAATLAATARLKSAIITATRDLTLASGNVAYTGVGFQPTSCLTTGMVAASLTQYQTAFGMADSARSVKAYALYAGTFTTTVNFLLFGDLGGSNLQGASIASYDSDGLTLTWTKTGSPTGTATFYIMCFR
jgi:hypothetical protein